MLRAWAEPDPFSGYVPGLDPSLSVVSEIYWAWAGQWIMHFLTDKKDEIFLKKIAKFFAQIYVANLIFLEKKYFIQIFFLLKFFVKKIIEKMNFHTG